MKATHLVKRNNIEKQIIKQKEKAIIHLNKIIDYRYKQRLVVAKSFEERERNFGTKKEPIMKTVKTMLYDDYFTDEDTQETITVKRHEQIEIDGKKCDDFGNIIKYYTIDDI